jgi:hypothetical protein
VIRVKLVTNKGEFVSYVQIPPFLDPPEVLIWGERVFIPGMLKFADKSDPTLPVYREAWACSATWIEMEVPYGTPSMS